MPQYRLLVRDPGRIPVAEVDDFAELQAIPRFNAVGTWSLRLPATSRPAQLLVEGGGLIVLRDGLTLLSGPVEQLDREWSVQGDMLTATGVDDVSLLAHRLAYPVPSGPPYTAQDYDVRTGVCETVLRQYVDANVGGAAAPARQEPALSLAADLGRGAPVTGRARFQTLLELLQGLALSGGLGFRIRQQVTAVGFPLEFECYVPTDRSTSALFSRELGTLQSFGYTRAAATANYVIAGGSGTGTSRTFAERGDAASITTYRRREVFLDQRDTANAAELDQAIGQTLAQQAQRTELRLTPIDTASLAFGVDYQLGDVVTVMVDGVAFTDVVREVQLTLRGDQAEQIVPTIGTPSLANSVVPLLFRALRDLRGRISHLERQ
ncbi:MAG TPA: siphovirus ReqiPepy6 Gp37-like family protein [Chloroflexota bacterium]|nr:siphovirus ReqiPepy6 Gp37-like family protein [Chloroflexota bacterium]